MAEVFRQGMPQAHFRPTRRALVALAAIATLAVTLGALLGDSAASASGAARRLREVTHVAAPGEKSLAGNNPLCSNRCYKEFGFTDDDCSCSPHGSWYMWVCTSRYGRPIQTQFCGQNSCGGCTYEAPPEEEPVPAPVLECSGAWDNCLSSRCCSTPGFKCFAKNEGYAQCRSDCEYGVHFEEPPQYWSRWSCDLLQPPSTAAPAPQTSPPAPVPTPSPSPPPEVTSTTPPETTTMSASSTEASTLTTTPTSPPTTTTTPTTAPVTTTTTSSTTTSTTEPVTTTTTSSTTTSTTKPVTTTTTSSTTTSTTEPVTTTTTSSTTTEPVTTTTTSSTTTTEPTTTVAPTTTTTTTTTTEPTTTLPPTTTPEATTSTSEATPATPEPTTMGTTTQGAPASSSTTSIEVTTPASTTTELPLPSGYMPFFPELLKPSTAETFTFYMYRVQNDMDYAPENQNMANLAGAMWYLHNEIVNNRMERRYGKTRIQRFKIRSKAPQPLADVGLNFGVRYAYDGGECTGPFNCERQFQHYGYFVGCNNVNDFPTQQWANLNMYPNATWYSLPGRCSTQRFNRHTQRCEIEQPGGACEDPTGQGNCTYSYEHAGEISIDELEGLEVPFAEFAAKGGWEYNNATDRGVDMTFWDDKYNATACEGRLEVARDLFRLRYPDDPSDEDMPAPPCDFDFATFFAWGTP